MDSGEVCAGDSPDRFASDLRELRGGRSFRDLERRNERVLDGAGRRSKSTFAAAEQATDGAGRRRVAPPDTVQAFVRGCGLTEAEARVWVRRSEELREELRRGAVERTGDVVPPAPTAEPVPPTGPAGAPSGPQNEPPAGAVGRRRRVPRWPAVVTGVAAVAVVVAVILIVGRSSPLQPELTGPRPGGDCPGEQVFRTPNGADGAGLTVTTVFVDRDTRTACALLTKRVHLGQDTYLSIELCNESGTCDRDGYRYPQEAGPVRVDASDSCLTVRVSALTPGDRDHLVPETEYTSVGC